VSKTLRSQGCVIPQGQATCGDRVGTHHWSNGWAQPMRGAGDWVHHPILSTLSSPTCHHDIIMTSSCFLPAFLPQATLEKSAKVAAANYSNTSAPPVAGGWVSWANGVSLEAPTTGACKVVYALLQQATKCVAGLPLLTANLWCTVPPYLSPCRCCVASGLQKGCVLVACSSKAPSQKTLCRLTVHTCMQASTLPPM
jgi:hypothetical protein